MSFKELRKDQRFDVVIDVVLETPLAELSAKTNNISLGGASVKLPFTVDLFNLDELVSVRLEQIGKLTASVVWQSQSVVGIKFNNPAYAGKLINEYLEQNGHI